MIRLLRVWALALALFCLPAPALGEYWGGERAVDCPAKRPNCRLLQMVMMGSFDGYSPGDAVGGRVLSAACQRLCGITEADIGHFSEEFGEPEERVRRNWYIALANALWARINVETPPEGGMDPASRVLLLFLDPRGEADGEAQMEQIRAAATDEALERLADAAGAPLEFVAWLIRDGDWQARGAEVAP